MKLKKLLFASSILALGLMSCNKDEVQPAPQETGDTYISVAMKMPQSRAGDNDFNQTGEYQGVDDIKTLTLFVANLSGVEVRELAGANDYTQTDNVVTSRPIKVKSGDKTIFAVINITPAIKDALYKAANLAQLKEAYEAAYDAIGGGIAVLDNGKDVIIMSGAAVAQHIKPAVSADNAAAQNMVKLNVKRGAARVSVTSNIEGGATGTYPIVATAPDGTTTFKLGELTDVRWTVAQYDKKFYLLQKENAGNYESPSFAYVTNGDYNAQAPTHYDYAQLLGERTLVHHLTAAYSATEIPNIAYRYAAETTHAEGNYKKGNTAYVLVSGVFKPEATMWADGEEAAYTAGGDLFLGLVTGKFYATEANANAANTVDGTPKVVTYKGAKMFYIAWVNPNSANADDWNGGKAQAPVHRNNLYNINISKFKNIGLSGNPLVPVDPDGPDNPDQPDPEDPELPDPDEPLPTDATHMVTEITIVPWTWHNYDVEL